MKLSLLFVFLLFSLVGIADTPGIKGNACPTGPQQYAIGIASSGKLTCLAGGGGGGAVDSVNGQTGVVVLSTSNIAEGSNLYSTNARILAYVLTNYASGAGTVSASDTILQAFQKLNGNQVLSKATADAALPSASFTDTAVTGKLLTNYSSAAGTVGASDTILQAINKLNGNQVLSKATADAALPSASFTSAAVTSKLITGYSSGAGPVAATDTILEAIDKLNGNQVLSKATADAALPSASFTDTAVTGKLITGFTSGAGAVSGADTILQAFNKLVGNLALKAPLASPAFTTQVTFSGYHMEPSENNAGNSSTAITIDLSAASVQKVTLTGNSTFTLSNPVVGGSYVLRIYTGAGSFSVTWPGTVRWPSDNSPVITPTAGRIDQINLLWDGSIYLGSYSQNYTP